MSNAICNTVINNANVFYFCSECINCISDKLTGPVIDSTLLNNVTVDDELNDSFKKSAQLEILTNEDVTISVS